MKRILLLSGNLKCSGVVTWLLHMQPGFLAAGADVVFLVTSKKSDIHPDGEKVFYTGRARSKFVLRISRWLQLHRIFTHWYEQRAEDEINRRVKKILMTIGWQDQIDLVVKNFVDETPECLRKWPVAGTIHSILSHEIIPPPALHRVRQQCCRAGRPKHRLICNRSYLQSIEHR
ncbi:MAG: hypothetical protein LBJ59_11860 [Zoogloeaceae bacterium]|jgi:hypothetical protein|nr:hypothetical protein [Zoogloeaceae bacterium]